MKAIRIHEHGGPDVLRLEEVPDPQPGPGEAVLEVRAAGINHLDLWVRKGLAGTPIPLPRIPGADAAGIVREVRDDATDLKPGDRVLLNPARSCGRCEFCTAGTASLCLSYSIFGEHCDGTYAEFMAVPARNLHRIPDSMTFEQAAAAPLVFLTAWRMLIGRARLQPSDDVLIVSGGSGVGTACIQIARLTGCRVFATAGSEPKCAKLREMGVDHVINHSEQDFAREILRITGKRGVDVVVDFTGKATWRNSLRSLRRGGRLVTCGATTGYDPAEDLRHVFYRQLEILGSTMGSDKDFRDVIKVLFEGKLQPVVHGTFPLGRAADAHREIEARRVFGKLILLPGERTA